MAVIFAGSADTQSAMRSSRLIGPLLRWLKPDISEATVARVQLAVRKAAHLTEYAILAILALWACRHSTPRNTPGGRLPWRWRHAGLALGLATAYAATDEFHQSFVPTRQGTPWDVLIDGSGAAGGLACVWLFGRWRTWW